MTHVPASPAAPAAVACCALLPPSWMAGSAGSIRDAYVFPRTTRLSNMMFAGCTARSSSSLRCVDNSNSSADADGYLRWTPAESFGPWQASPMGNSAGELLLHGAQGRCCAGRTSSLARDNHTPYVANVQHNTHLVATLLHWLRLCCMGIKLLCLRMCLRHGCRMGEESSSGLLLHLISPFTLTWRQSSRCDQARGGNSDVTDEV